MGPFQELTPECNGTVNVTTFGHQTDTYTISTTDIRHLQAIQSRTDRHAGYTGLLGNFETMLFINQNDDVYPWGDLPGHPGLGVFQRYDTEDEARDGHQEFVTRVQRFLLAREQPAQQP